MAEQGSGLSGPASPSPVIRHTPVAAVSLLAAGVYGLLVGGLLLLPFAVNSTAIQNDVYMGNLFFGPPLLGIGGICALAGLIGVILSPGRRSGRVWAQGTLPGIAGAVLLTGAYLLFGGQYWTFEATAPEWPPYLTMPLLVLVLLLGLAVAVAAWAWAARTERRA